MNASKHLIGLALLAALGLTQAAHAEDYDDRWYMTWGFGYNKQDTDRRTRDNLSVTASLGRFLNPDWSLDVELNWQDPGFDAKKYPNAPSGLDWHQFGISADFRRYLFVSPDRGWNPYVLLGAGYQRVEEEHYNMLGQLSRRKDGNLSAKIGAGVQTPLGERNVAIRAEVFTRIDFDDHSIAANGPTHIKDYPHKQSESYFTDTVAQITVMVPFGRAAAPPPPPQAPCPVCAPPPKPAPVPVPPPPPPPVPVALDISGVLFDVGKADLRPNAMVILDKAIATLKANPNVRVEVASHTDSDGTDASNQALSERRAKVVYDYLVKNGIAANRLQGPTGYGSKRPVASNATPEGKAKNRRTELNIIR